MPTRSFLAALSLCLVSSFSQADTTKSWSMAEFGEPLYQEDMPHWPYVNPAAPKGGSIVLGGFGSYDSLNSFILKGEWPRSLVLISDTLMTASADELSVMYGLIAETVEYPDDKSWIIFNLRPEATFSDGEPITAHDFEFAFSTIREHGRPFLKSFYNEVEGVEVLDDHRLKFTFNTRDNMKPLIKVAGMSPAHRKYWSDKDISKTYLKPAPTSGSYYISDVDAGRSITYQRVENYWGEKLNVNLGLSNFDTIRYDYYRDLEVMAEAFKSGEMDFRIENSSKRWATAYKIPAVDSGDIILDEQPDNVPQGIQAYFFNLRREPFSDQRVRQAFDLLNDFETTRRTILYNQYERINSYFPNSEFGAAGPPTAEEVAILEPYRDRLPAEVFDKAYLSPVTDGSGRIRKQMRTALKLFNEAGWKLQNGKLMKNGKQMEVEFMLVSADSQRVQAPFVQNLKKAGIDAKFRIVDSAQYQVRVDDFDFDIVTVRLNFFPPPGPELRSYYGSAAADERGSANMAGIQNEVADELIEQIINAKTLEELKATTRALDRVLLWNNYSIPQFYNAVHRVAYWNRFGRPDKYPRYISYTGFGFPTSWWIDPDLDSQLDLER